jgi:hypothetical protein
MNQDPREPEDRHDGERDAGGDSFVDRHLGKIVAAALLVGLLGVAARALVA